MFLWDSKVCEPSGFLCLYLFLAPFLGFFSFYLVFFFFYFNALDFVLSYFILFYFISLEACLFSSKRPEREWILMEEEVRRDWKD